MAHFRVVWRKQRNRVILPELNVYPEAAPVVDIPDLLKATRIGRKVRLQPQAHQITYPAAITGYPAYLLNRVTVTRTTKRQLLTLALDKYLEKVISPCLSTDQFCYWPPCYWPANYWPQYYWPCRPYRGHVVMLDKENNTLRLSEESTTVLLDEERNTLIL